MHTRFLRSLLPALALALAFTAVPSVSSAGVFVGVSVNIPPPPLPVYVQPRCPEAGYIWTPGYWAWGPYGYYWVPGTWVLPPQVGLFWTPGWWGWDADGDDYRWHAGYWGPQVGFYGGIDYGFGYYGTGFVGGYWHRGVFFYNRAVVNVGPAIGTNVYYRDVYHREGRHVSFNGGRGGLRARPTRLDRFAARARRFGMTAPQRRHIRMAGSERTLRVNFNHGRPPIAATMRPTAFHGRGVMRARAAGGAVHMRRGPMHIQRGPAHAQQHAPRMRSDRPPWASESGRSPRPSQPRYNPQQFQSRPQHAPRGFRSQPPQRAPQRFQPRRQPPTYGPPQDRFQPRSNGWQRRQPVMPRFHQPTQRFQGPQVGPRGAARPEMSPRARPAPRGRPEGRRGPPERRR